MALLTMATPTVALLTMGLQGGALGVITRERLQCGEELGVDQRGLAEAEAGRHVSCHAEVRVLVRVRVRVRVRVKGER